MEDGRKRESNEILDDILSEKQNRNDVSDMDIQGGDMIKV